MTDHSMAQPDTEHQIVAVWRDSMNHESAVMIDGVLVRASAFRVEQAPLQMPLGDPIRVAARAEEPPTLWVGFKLDHSGRGSLGSNYLTLNTRGTGEYTLIKKEELEWLRARAHDAESHDMGHGRD